MAFTRVYVGAHYPSDALADVALGAIVAGAGYLAVLPALHRLASGLAGTPLRPLLITARATTPQTTPEQV